ncbi:uncharacterized protein A4U43_C09F3020 [Asparagus officinalis]|uniref:DDT domain-containing protein n=1 Tax=Asparagus officinalis TaxID=4686 RepID=A0A5P1E877_ASPOF|nr:DDT domain-containing protein DDB_G0282237 [Asparagus officinalis]XP_020246467.1 DDT domain-containing protein DDB_G0282237 [Asparagus officinalis]XP_020246468.1 DDT domain-containing protein DDB_G0282237 [Asparagus officinalis]ONK57685.1 uncharacterized protein A4U43_C09F3020 [Asparagus officinalis]
MPLHKKKPFPLVDPPHDLKPSEHVYQIRFTKEVLRDYQEYLNRLNLYRQRVWTCKTTGKTNLTYEQALVSERRAAEKVQQFPKELMNPVLQMIQYSTLTLKDLVDTIYSKFREHLFEGLELHVWKEKFVYACKILKLLEDESGTHYEVGLLDNDKRVTETLIVKESDLIRKKAPYSRSVLKAFIRESTSQSAPWMLHEKLAEKHGISTKPPENLHTGNTIGKKRKNTENGSVVDMDMTNKRTKKDGDATNGIRIKYPIEDLLVQPAANDPAFSDRPSLYTSFKVPMDCVGDLLMIWDFCSSFARLLNLWRFSLEDFENAICHKDSNLILIVEAHAALLRLLIKDEGNYFMIIEGKKRKSKITVITWKEFLCDFLEMEGREELTKYLGTIRRGHYGLLEVSAKLSIFRDLVSEALKTNAIRARVDECIEQQQELAAKRREEDKRKKEEHSKTSDKQGHQEGNPQNGERNAHSSDVNGKAPQDEDVLSVGKQKAKVSKKLGNSQNGKRNAYSSSVNGKASQDEDSLPLGKWNVKVSKKSYIQENGEKNHRAAGFGELIMENGNYSEKVKGVSPTSGGIKSPGRRKYKEKDIQEKLPEEEQKDYIEKELEKLSIRTNPLGKDRNHNRYWFFRRDGRLFVESSDSIQWGYYSTKEELDALMGSLNPKGVRERALQKQLQKHYQKMSMALQKRSKEAAQNALLEDSERRRSTRVRVEARKKPAFFSYVNKWKDD